MCYMFPEIHRWYNTCQPLGSQYGSSAVPCTYKQALVGLETGIYCATTASQCKTRQMLYWLNCAGSASLRTSYKSEPWCFNNTTEKDKIRETQLVFNFICWPCPGQKLMNFDHINRIMFSCYFNFNAFTSILISINLAVSLPPNSVIVFWAFGELLSIPLEKSVNSPNLRQITNF